VNLFLLTAEGRLFGLDQQTLISIAIQLFNACVLVGVLTYMLYKPVRKFLQKRSDGIAEQLAGADGAKADAEALRMKYEAKLEALEAERAKVLDNAYHQAEEKTRKMVEEAEAQIAVQRQQAAEQLREERARSDGEVKRHIIDVASVMAAKIVAHSLDEGAQTRLFDEAVADLETGI